MLFSFELKIRKIVMVKSGFKMTNENVPVEKTWKENLNPRWLFLLSFLYVFSFGKLKLHFSTKKCKKLDYIVK